MIDNDYEETPNLGKLWLNPSNRVLLKSSQSDLISPGGGDSGSGKFDQISRVG